MHGRRALAALAAIGALALTGCTGGSDRSDGVTVSDARSTSGSATSTGSATGSPTPGSPTAGSPTAGASTPGGSSGVSTPVATASVAQPSDPVVAAGDAGAWSLTRAAPGAPQSRQIPTLTCGQDGSVAADGLALSAGAASLTLTDPAVTVTGTADLDAAGGTFRGRNADTAVTFTWVC